MTFFGRALLDEKPPGFNVKDPDVNSTVPNTLIVGFISSTRIHDYVEVLRTRQHRNISDSVQKLLSLFALPLLVGVNFGQHF
mmetsp:Transcript_55801/g.104677  ORF Transcript_55801/g.104677 Transcript_55801/m.104677 type:complete len:82 (+) Transcript_55801:619-864(+)